MACNILVTFVYAFGMSDQLIETNLYSHLECSRSVFTDELVFIAARFLSTLKSADGLRLLIEDLLFLGLGAMSICEDSRLETRRSCKLYRTRHMCSAEHHVNGKDQHQKHRLLQVPQTGDRRKPRRLRAVQS